MQRVIIVHRWSGNPDSDWYPWLASELKKKGFEVIVPDIKDRDEPKIDVWVNELKKAIGENPDKDTFFIAHSIGCQTVMRYLETLPEKTKIGGCVFVAGWFNLANLEGEEVEAIAKPWIETPINFEKIKKICDRFVVFLSSNEPYNYVEENAKTFKEKLSAEVTILENKGHFTEDDSIKEMPEVLQKIEEVSKKPTNYSQGH
jgi:predicted alpha/beta hydrolase family esterase